MERRPERNISEDWTFYSMNTSKEYSDPQCNVTYVVFYLHKPSVAAVFIVSYLLIFLVCMVGNGVVCFTIVRSKNMRTVTNVFILNLAVSDLLVGIFCMPTTLLDNIITGWPFGSLVCKMSGMVQGISVSASVFTLVAIAVDRFWCIVYPFKQKLTLSTSTLIIVIIWVLAVSIMCPSGVMLQVTEAQNIRILLGDNETIPFYWCRENWPTQEMRKIYTTILFANIYLAPLTLIVIMYARIGITLFKSSMLTGKKPGQDTRQTVSKKKKRVLKMLLIVALLFIVSWSPLWALMMLSDYASLTEYQHKLINIYIYPFAHWLAFFNSSINPIIYGFFNENFQRGFQAAFSKFHLCSAEVTRGQTYAHRIQGNVVRPANLQTSNGTNPVHSRANSHSMRSHALNEQDLIMEDL